MPTTRRRAPGSSRLEDVWAEADLILGVKEPQPQEVELLRPEATLFTYLHLAPAPELTQGPVRIGRDLRRL